jgi:hypothetical protein
MPETIDDTTPLDGPRIDVPARIGWLLRTHRSLARLSLRDMSAALAARGPRISAATLSRIEAEGQRNSAVIDGYTEVLGLPDGLLHTSVSMLCGSFSYAPEAPPETTPRCLDSFSEAYDAVATGTPTAGDWLRFARQHASDVGFGLPRSLMEPMTDRLLSESGRAVGTARITRHLALTRLLRSPYRDLVHGRIRAAVEDPGHQFVHDLFSVISDSPGRDTVLWAGRMLSGPTRFHVRGASQALQAMLVGGQLGVDVWRELVPHVEEAWRRAEGDADRCEALGTLCASLPPVVQAELGGVTGDRPTTPRSWVRWSRTSDNVHYAFALRIARAATSSLGHPEEPLLARLVFEGCFEPRGVRMAQAFWLVGFSAFAGAVKEAILSGLAHSPDDLTRARALQVASVCHAGEPVEQLGALLARPTRDEFLQVLKFVGRSGARLPDAALVRGLAADEQTVRQTLSCLGMAGDARLATIAEDPSHPEDVRRTATWWLKEGSRILA